MKERYEEECHSYQTGPDRMEEDDSYPGKP